MTTQTTIQTAARHVLIWRDGKMRAGSSLDMITNTPREPGTLVWLDAQGDPREYRAYLARTFGLRRITLDVIEEERERAKLIEGGGYFSLVVHDLRYNAETEEAETPKIDLVFAPTFLLTFHREPLPWLDRLRESVRADASPENPMARGMPFLLHAVLDTLVDGYFPMLDELDNIIDEMENATVTSTSNAVQQRIFRMKRALAQMRRVISPQVEVTNALVTRTGDTIPQESEPYFADVHDHLVRAFEVIDSYRDLMSGLLDVYLTTVSNRMNAIMKQLTLIATIFLPITFVTGVFGMNFGHSPQVEHDAGWNFWLALLVMGAITAAQIWYFKRRGWIGE